MLARARKGARGARPCASPASEKGGGMGGSSASAASEVRRSLEGVLRTSLELQQSVAHFRPEQQADVLRKVGELAEGLAAVDRAKVCV